MARPRRGLTGYRRRVLATDALCRKVVMVRAGAAVFTDAGREQWRGACRRCGKPAWLSWCHYYSRAIHAVRWDLDNTEAFCSGCHLFFDQHPAVFTAWWIEHIGAERHADLVIRAGTAGRRPDLSGIMVALEIELARLLRSGEGLAETG